MRDWATSFEKSASGSLIEAISCSWSCDCRWRGKGLVVGAVVARL